MARPKIKILSEKREELRELMRGCKNPKDKERLQAAMLATGGDHTIAEIAEVVCRAKSAVQKWLENWREGGLEGLLKRGKAHGKKPILSAQEIELLRGKLEEGQSRSVVQIQRWLLEQTGKPMSYGAVRYWLGKWEAVMRVPRPSHIKKNPQAVMEFRARLEEKLLSVPIKSGRKVKVWVSDEGRFGLHSFTRRVWTRRGARPVAPQQQKYQWEYVYGALECSEGGAEFAYLPYASQDTSLIFLEQIAQSDPSAEHIIIQDGAGFHLRPADQRLPENVYMLNLPPYSPELNPIEKLWDIVQDGVCNQAFKSIPDLHKKLTPELAAYWNSSASVLRLIGRNWLSQTVNASSPRFIPVFN
jgi:transposase